MYNSSAKHKIWLGISPTHARGEGVRGGCGSYQGQDLTVLPQRLQILSQKISFQSSSDLEQTRRPRQKITTAEMPSPILTSQGADKASEVPNAAINSKDKFPKPFDKNVHLVSFQNLSIRSFLPQKPEFVKGKADMRHFRCAHFAGLKPCATTDFAAQMPRI